MNMNSFLDKIKPENYQRAFFFKNLGYLVSELINHHYKKLDWLIIYKDGVCGSYVGNAAAERALQNGKAIFSNKRNFSVFEAGFRKNIEECKEYIHRIKGLTSAQISDFYDLRAMIEKTYYFFEKTEFFFTDACYYGEMSDVLKKNLFTLGDDLKMKSRPLFVEIFTTCLYKLVYLVAKQSGVDAEDIKFFSFQEVVDLLELQKKPSKTGIIERQKTFVTYCQDNQVFPEITGDDKLIVLERFEEPDYSKITEFKGVIANKGKVTARVRVILPEMNMDYEAFVQKLHSMEMHQGEILVTETTSPDFVPLMKKSGGIIANQGGLNSHAAIMSRELGVPCLVGTYHATDALKTGDLIELDADSGTVKIIEKTRYVI